MTGIILAHGSIAEACARHFPSWSETFSQLITIAPWDDPIRGASAIGDSAKSGRGSLERMMFAVALASRFDRAAILEYDTVFCGPRFQEGFPTEGELISSCIFENQDPRTFSAPIYGHSPWIATGETWWKILQHGGDPQGFFPDRWLYASAHDAGIKPLGIEGSFSEDREWTFETRIKAVGCRAKGGKIFHGVKTARDFEAITAGHWHERHPEAKDSSTNFPPLTLPS